MTARGLWGAEQPTARDCSLLSPSLPGSALETCFALQALQCLEGTPPLLPFAEVSPTWWRPFRTGKHFLLKAARGVAVGLACAWALVCRPHRRE